MTNHDETAVPASPFHEGELTLQRQAGAAERMDALGRRVVRRYMPDQHRAFFEQLPFLLVGTVDHAGDAWASLVTGAAGFASSPDPHTLQVRAAVDEDDPVAPGLTSGAGVGLLGIELHTRRRNRMNGRLSSAGPDGFAVHVEHSFGNCPKYIQLRDVEIGQATPRPASQRRELDGLDRAAREMIARADTFFVASYVDLEDGVRQVDVSHRGGKPGFVHVGGDDVLTIPDFAGNLHFNTLGNIVANGKAGLLFVDFETGDLLQLTGQAQVIPTEPANGAFEGSERRWTFRPRRIVCRAAATSLRWHSREDGLSPFLRMTGSWDAAVA
ncbi:pyridoxamine 5'-phosphate oxidase family protein [Stappia indica]|uniref:pyridoxamine 5'-phosphate oxidase family protein n=1 Tax=Stappia indica TaxID=538381 RepID=UPI0008377F9C|nr:pyridoxamine 5'-phosphate oxidase family protein [Stappia indica]